VELLGRVRIPASALNLLIKGLIKNNFLEKSCIKNGFRYAKTIGEKKMELIAPKRTQTFFTKKFDQKRNSYEFKKTSDQKWN